MACMEDVLDGYERPADPEVGCICFDERPCQLLGDVIAPLPMPPGQERKEDYEYECYGTCALLLAYDLDRENATYRCVSSATLADYAAFMDWFVSTHYAATTKVQAVQDNLNTHTSGAFYEHLPAERAHQLKNTLEFHFTPKYGSWLNRAEIELSVLVRQCLDRPIASREELEREVLAWQNERNDTTVKIAWTSTTPKARLKFQRHYKKLNSKN
jgi:hypothetical protein